MKIELSYSLQKMGSTDYYVIPETISVSDDDTISIPIVNLLREISDLLNADIECVEGFDSKDICLSIKVVENNEKGV